jgi:photosynthesis system II assembly factor YCF48-like protein
MATDEREPQFERALARHLRNSSPDSACPDSETLAAYHECALSLDEMARWKEHIVNCARCQEILVLIEQSEHVQAEEWEDQNVPVAAEQAVAPLMRAATSPRQEESSSLAAEAVRKVTPIVKAKARRPLRWAVPLGAVAAAVIVWVGIHEHGLQRGRFDESVQVARNRQTPPAAAPTPESTPQKNELATTRALDEETRAKKSTPPSQSPEPPRAQVTANLPSGAVNKLDNKEDKRKDVGGMLTADNLKSVRPNAPKTREVDGFSAAGVPTAAPRVSGGVAGNRARDEGQQKLKKQAPPVPTNQEVSGGAQAQTPPPAPITTQTVTVEPPKQPSAASESVEVQQSTELQQQVTNNTVAELSRNSRASKAGFRQAAASDRRYIVTPDERQAWRVGDQGAILRTSNSGKTWKEQNSGVTADLVSGSAPSRDVCWLIGKAGTILLTTDGGKHWKQVASPITGDLGSIVATDALRAAVWDAAGQKSFKTNDGGETWTPANQ